MFSLTQKALGSTRHTSLLALFFVMLMMPPVGSYAESGELNLDKLIAEGLKNSPEILASQARAEAAGYRVSQAKSLPDPMFMLGYQNEGFRRLNIGEAENAMGMFSISQMFPFPGKLDLKGEMATKNAESQTEMYNAIKLRTIAQIKSLYQELFLAYKTIDILKGRADLLSKIEGAAQARYASGTGMQQEVIMAQTEKYMILEKEEMQKQRIQSLQGMLTTIVGRPVNSPLGRPAQPPYTQFSVTLDDLVARAFDFSPEVRSKQKMLEGAEAKLKMAKKEYYPDVTLGASYFPRTKGMDDMWNFTATINLPIFFRTKQRQTVNEAQATLTETKQDLSATKLMVSSNIRDSLSMVETTDRLMKLYNEGLIPKANQDVQLAFSNYVTGKVDALTVITRIKNLLDYEVLYWNQFVEREKAVVRILALTGGEAHKSEGGDAGTIP